MPMRNDFLKNATAEVFNNRYPPRAGVFQTKYGTCDKIMRVRGTEIMESTCSKFAICIGFQSKKDFCTENWTQCPR